MGFGSVCSSSWSLLTCYFHLNLQLCGIVSCFNKSIDSNCLFSKILMMRRNHITCGLTLKRHQHEGHVYIVEHKNTDQVDQILCCDLPILYNLVFSFKHRSNIHSCDDRAHFISSENLSACKHYEPAHMQSERCYIRETNIHYHP